MTLLLFARKDPRTRGEKPVCIPICQSSVQSSFNAFVWPLQATLVQTINKTRNDALLTSFIVYSPPTWAWGSIDGNEKRGSTYRNIISSNTVLFPSFALYHPSISPVCLYFPYTFSLHFIYSFVCSFFLLLSFSLSHTLFPFVLVIVRSSAENKKCMLNLCGPDDKFAYQILGIRSRGIEQAVLLR